MKKTLWDFIYSIFIKTSFVIITLLLAFILNLSFMKDIQYKEFANSIDYSSNNGYVLWEQDKLLFKIGYYFWYGREELTKEYIVWILEKRGFKKEIIEQFKEDKSFKWIVMNGLKSDKQGYYSPNDNILVLFREINKDKDSFSEEDVLIHEFIHYVLYKNKDVEKIAKETLVKMFDDKNFQTLQMWEIMFIGMDIPMGFLSRIYNISLTGKKDSGYVNTKELSLKIENSIKKNDFSDERVYLYSQEMFTFLFQDSKMVKKVNKEDVVFKLKESIFN